VEIDYRLGEAGSANARILHGDKCYEMPGISYLSDALGDMAQATVSLMTGADSAIFSFQDEPGEWRWVLQRGEADSLSIRIYRSEINFAWKLKPVVEVFYCECVVLDFVGQVFAILHTILKEHGVEGYKQRWRNFEFPIAVYQKLQLICE
jgi:hypothetical protein